MKLIILYYTINMSMALGMIDPQPAISRQMSSSTGNLTLHKVSIFIKCHFM